MPSNASHKKQILQERQNKIAVANDLPTTDVYFDNNINLYYFSNGEAGHTFPIVI